MKHTYGRWRMYIGKSKCNLKSLDLLKRIDSGCRYLSWWYLSGKYPTLMYICENLSKIVCHASLLKSDDIRLKRQTAAKFCELCDLSVIDDANHLVMQCPSLPEMRKLMFDVIRERCFDVRPL